MGIREAPNKGDPPELRFDYGQKTMMNNKKKNETNETHYVEIFLRPRTYYARNLIPRKKNSINTSDLSAAKIESVTCERLLPLNSKRVIVGNGSYRGVIKWRRVRYQTVPRLTERITITKLDDVNRSCDCRSQLFPMPITTSLFNTFDL